MDSEVVVVYAREEPPQSWDAAVFLAGPTPRGPGAESWRPAAVDRLRGCWAGSGRLVVFVPEHRHGVHDDYRGQVDWEERCLHLSDEIVFWIPRDLRTMPAFTTNVEWGMWHDSGRVVFGAPPQAPKNDYLRHYAGKFGVPVSTTLDGVIAAALDRIGGGAPRTGGEREVPLLIWRLDGFQRWYAAQRGAGNVLRGARLLWHAGPLWGMRVAVEVAAEGRVKDNEVVFSRPDISVVVLHRPGPTLDETVVVLVREFRSAAATADGMVHELPGGSGPADPLRNAVEEVTEETGLVLDPARLHPHGARQVNATMSAHRAHLFSAEITGEELAAIRGTGPHGQVDLGERTYVEAATFAEIRRARLVDWATLGMIAEALTTVRPRG
ncbi:Nucleoside 2-deoxyribosyltransferase like [Thermomonospora echinospora]|uniref:Nucleoside 2-deoxyribosyltransferase like n=1 Tax=Thermomonospora echinospora TaxID=1992 RepID=A0A1H5SWK0_9ACTN|nr:nucleoside 2-deoxyribosyltransferase domain-containing protein [Thermomonospora echinospora]SEF54963.1 Nucleoside 2-deoxyribosyltransferase like [Thermomonospora echinospora]